MGKQSQSSSSISSSSSSTRAKAPRITRQVQLRPQGIQYTKLQKKANRREKRRKVDKVLENANTVAELATLGLPPIPPAERFNIQPLLKKNYDMMALESQHFLNRDFKRMRRDFIKDYKRQQRIERGGSYYRHLTPEDEEWEWGTFGTELGKLSKRNIPLYVDYDNVAVDELGYTDKIKEFHKETFLKAINTGSIGEEDWVHYRQFHGPIARFNEQTYELLDSVQATQAQNERNMNMWNKQARKVMDRGLKKITNLASNTDPSGALFAPGGTLGENIISYLDPTLVNNN